MSRIQQVAIVLWVTAVVLGTRYVFGPIQSFGDQQYLEYVTPYLALSTLIQLGFLVVFAKEALAKVTTRNLAIVLLFGVLGIANSANSLLSLWWFCLLLVLVWSGSTLASVLHNTHAKKIFVWSLISLGTLEAILALLQFTLQHSLGLSLLGEPIANANTLGVAKVLLQGHKLLRPFGTFAHANVLGGFLVLSTLALLSQTNQIFTKYPLLFHLLLGIHILADLFTYSRSTWISLAIILIYFSLKWGLKITLPSIAVGIIALTLFSSATYGRFDLQLQEQQIDIRTQGISVAVDALKVHPLGVGLRGFIPYYRNAQPELPVFYYQPAHNSLLLLAVELGSIGALLLVVYGVQVLYKNRSAYVLLVAGVALTLGLFDHYLLTLAQGLGILSLYVLLPLVLRRDKTKPNAI